MGFYHQETRGFLELSGFRFSFTKIPNQKGVGPESHAGGEIQHHGRRRAFQRLIRVPLQQLLLWSTQRLWKGMKIKDKYIEISSEIMCKW